MEYSYVRYLLAKQPIDDRAINRTVLESLQRHLAQRSAVPRVLELGAGVGTMVSRLADWGVLKRGRYTLVDRDSDSLRAAQQHLEQWSGAPGIRCSDSIQLTKGDAAVDVHLVQRDLLDFTGARECRHAFDLVIANAVLDLFDLEPTLPRIWQALAPGSLFWFTINFDGETIFLPETRLDQTIMRLYHGTMCADADGTRAGHSQTGRRLLAAVPATGASLLAAGSSDWVVFPQQGGYAGDEAYFLHHIVETIRGAIAGSSELGRDDLARWVADRHAQIDNGELCYVAHQLDVLGCVP